MQNDGKLLAVGILYASYLGGDEGYTATACDGQDWFDQLFWLGVNRAPAGWHKWTFDLRPRGGHPGSPQRQTEVHAPSIRQHKAGLKGFSAIAIWGDSGKGREQTIWVDDVVGHAGRAGEDRPRRRGRSVRRRGRGRRPGIHRPGRPDLHQGQPPATPKLEDLPLKESVSQYGITWTFEKPARVGQFVNGDWYVVGPVTVKAIDPKPLYGAEIPETELDRMDKERPGRPACPQRLHAQPAGRDEGRLRQRRAELVRSRRSSRSCPWR